VTSVCDVVERSRSGGNSGGELKLTAGDAMLDVNLPIFLFLGTRLCIHTPMTHHSLRCLPSCLQAIASIGDKPITTSPGDMLTLDHSDDRTESSWPSLSRSSNAATSVRLQAAQGVTFSNICAVLSLMCHTCSGSAQNQHSSDSESFTSCSPA
jgi:hypothetical protein